MARRLLLLTLVLASSAALAQTRTEQLQTVGTPGPIDKTTQTEDVHFRVVEVRGVEAGAGIGVRDG